MALLQNLLFLPAYFFCSADRPRAAVLPAPAQPAVRIFHRKKHEKVWVNTASGIYHCPGTRWYGKTGHGKYMDEYKARKADSRPANYRPCGSERKQ